MASPARASAATAPPLWVADASLAAVTLVWGFTFPVVKGALASASPLLFNAARLGAAAVLLAAVCRPAFLQWPWATWRDGSVLGACLAAGYAFQTVGLAATSASQSAFLTSLSVVLVPLLLALGWRRHLPARAWAGAVLALAGLLLLVRGPAATSALRRGDALTLACAVAFGLHIVCLGEFAPRHRLRDLAFLQIFFAAILTGALLPVMALSGASALAWRATPALWTALALTAVLATAVAFSTQAWAQQFTPATHAAVIFSLEPVFAALASFLLWHERLRAIQIMGASLILLAVLTVDLGAHRPDPASPLAP